MNNLNLIIMVIIPVIPETVIPVKTEDWKSELKTEDQDWRLKNYVRPKSWYISPTTYKTYYISNTDTASKNGMKISNFSLLTFSSFIHNEYIYLNNYFASSSNP